MCGAQGVSHSHVLFVGLVLDCHRVLCVHNNVILCAIVIIGYI